MREIVHLQAGQCGNQIGAKVTHIIPVFNALLLYFHRCLSALLETSIVVSFDGCQV